MLWTKIMHVETTSRYYRHHRHPIKVVQTNKAAIMKIKFPGNSFIMVKKKLFLQSLFILVICNNCVKETSGNEDWINTPPDSSSTYVEMENGPRENPSNTPLIPDNGIVISGSSNQAFPSSSNSHFISITTPALPNQEHGGVIPDRKITSTSGTIATTTFGAGSKVERAHSRFRSLEPTICLNATAITKAVHLSEVVFAGKILKLFEQMPTSSSDLEQTARRNSHNNDYSAKRRRESYFGDSLVRRIKATPPQPTQQLKPFPRYEAVVLVKTVFKGGTKDMEDTTVFISVDPNEVIKQGKSVARCVRRLRALDTRLFFYKAFGSDGDGLENAEGGRQSSNSINKNSMNRLATLLSTSRISGDISSTNNPGKMVTFRSPTQTFWPVPPTLLVLDAIRAAVRGKQTPFFSIFASEMSLKWLYDLISDFYSSFFSFTSQIPRVHARLICCHFTFKKMQSMSPTSPYKLITYACACLLLKYAHLFMYIAYQGNLYFLFSVNT